MNERGRRGAIGALAVAAVILAGAGDTRAQEPRRDPAAAEALFAAGKRLMEQRKLAEACAKFEESHRLDPGVGALLNLAACQEQRGRIASAWGHYRDAEAQLRSAGDARRAQFARGRADALEPRLPKVVITVASPPDGLVVARDGVRLSVASLGTELPVDPGPHELVAEAPGHAARTVTFTVRERQVARVDIPPLEEAAVEAPAAPPPVGGPTPPPGVDDGDPGATQRVVAYALGGAGLASLVLGGVFVGLTASNTAAADDGCPTPTTCSAVGFEAVEDARTTAIVADVTLIGGAALVAAGVVVYLTAPSADETEEAALVPLVGRSTLGLGATGRF